MGLCPWFLGFLWFLAQGKDKEIDNFFYEEAKQKHILDRPSLFGMSIRQRLYEKGVEKCQSYCLEPDFRWTDPKSKIFNSCQPLPQGFQGLELSGRPLKVPIRRLLILLNKLEGNIYRVSHKKLYLVLEECSIPKF